MGETMTMLDALREIAASGGWARPVLWLDTGRAIARVADNGGAVRWGLVPDPSGHFRRPVLPDLEALLSEWQVVIPEVVLAEREALQCRTV